MEKKVQLPWFKLWLRPAWKRKTFWFHTANDSTRSLFPTVHKCADGWGLACCVRVRGFFVHCSVVCKISSQIQLKSLNCLNWFCLGCKMYKMYLHWSAFLLRFLSFLHSYISMVSFFFKTFSITVFSVCAMTHCFPFTLFNISLVSTLTYLNTQYSQ